MLKKQNPEPTFKQKSAEKSFREVYTKTELAQSDFDATIQRCHELIKKVSLIPLTSTIQNWEGYSRPSFARFSIESESKPFYEASMAVAEFITLLSLDAYNDNPSKFTSGILKEIQEDWSDCTKCPKLQDLMRAGFGVAAGIDQLVDQYYTPENLKFLANTFLLQSSISQTFSYQLVLESFGKVFVIQVLKNYKQKIQQFVQNENDVEQKGLFTAGPKKATTDFSDFLSLVSVIARMYKRCDFQRLFFNLANDLLALRDISTNSFVATYMSTLASLVVDKEMADAIYDTLNKLITYNITHFLNAIQGYVSDFRQLSANRSRLSELDSKTLEAKLDLIAKLLKFSEECRENINALQKNVASSHGLDGSLESDTLVNNLIYLIHSAIPATLKARCFDVLSSLATEGMELGVSWETLEATEILTQDQIEKDEGGIISEISQIEVKEKSFPLLRSFLRFVSFLMAKSDTHPSPEYAQRLHIFMLENVLVKLNNGSFNYNHFNEKYSILCELSQAWNNMFFQDPVIYNNLLGSAFCDQRFIREFVSLIVEESCPLEALLCVFRLFCSIAEHEKEFQYKMQSADHSAFIPLSKQFSWEAEALRKIILSIGERKDKDLQICAINFTQYIAYNSPDISQVIFARSRPKHAFVTVLSVDEEENDIEHDGEELTLRVKLLNCLNSLGSSSYLVRSVCGFDVSDMPASLQHSALDQGILPTLLEKMDVSHENRNQFPRFIAASLQLLLLLCNHISTITYTLNLLRSSSHSFFNLQLKSLQDPSTSSIAIGTFLQIISREATESNQKTGTTTNQVIQILFGTEGFGDKRERAILSFVFLDRIDDTEGSTLIAQGLFETCIAFLSNPKSIELMSRWQATWAQFVLIAIQKASEISNPETTKYLTQCVGFVSRFLFKENSFGHVSEEDMLQIFASSIESLLNLDKKIHSESKLGIYTLIASLFDRSDFVTQKSNEIYQEHNYMVANVLNADTNIEPPIARAAVFACAEALIPLATDGSLEEFIGTCINQLEEDWEIYDEDNERGTFIILSKLSLFTRFLTISQNPKLFIDHHIIQHIAHEPFWSSLAESFSMAAVSEISETKLRTASGSLRVFTTLLLVSDSKFVEEEIQEFIETYQDQFKAVITFGGYITLDSLSFIVDLCYFAGALSTQLSADLRTRFKELGTRFEKSEKWRELLRKSAGKTRAPSLKTYAIATKMTKNIISVINEAVQ